MSANTKAAERRPSLFMLGQVVYHCRVITRLYIENFRCLDKFELPTGSGSSMLLIGKNGSGKSSVRRVLELLQKIANGTNRLSDLLSPEDFYSGRTGCPIRVELDVQIEGRLFEYRLEFEFPKDFKELRVLSERLHVAGSEVYAREVAQVHMPASGKRKDATFFIDWHLVALPILQSGDSSIGILRAWLSTMILLNPIPALIDGVSKNETRQPEISGSNLGAWFSGLLADYPSSYKTLDQYLRTVMPDFLDVTNPVIGMDTRRLVFQFSVTGTSVKLNFSELSEGEKCFMICALVLATCEVYNAPFCFWDEPDNHLSLTEVGHFIIALRTAVKGKGQLVVTSHNPEAIRRFSEENTFYLSRASHIQPTRIQLLADMKVQGDLIDALVRDDL